VPATKIGGGAGCVGTATGAGLTGTGCGSGGDGGAGLWGETRAPLEAFFSSFLRGFSAGRAAGGGIGVLSGGAGAVGFTSDASFSDAADFVSDGAGEEHAEAKNVEMMSEKYNLRK